MRERKDGSAVCETVFIYQVHCLSSSIEHNISPVIIADSSFIKDVR
jgi:hypothetical protein